MNQMSEFFDKEYTAKQAYGRLYQYARKYRFRLLIGLLAGSVTAGSWVPLFQVVQPVLKQFQMTGASASSVEPVVSANVSQENAESSGAVLNDGLKGLIKQRKRDKAAEANTELPDWFKRVETFGNRCGVTFRDANGHMTGQLLLIGLFILPIVMAVKMVAMYLNNYCLRWTGTKVVQDFRVDMFSHLQKQSLCFFGRIDVGQLMSRCTSDPQQVDSVITSTLADLCRAPFEILVAFGFVFYFAIQNDMLETLF